MNLKYKETAYPSNKRLQTETEVPILHYVGSACFVTSLIVTLSIPLFAVTSQKALIILWHLNEGLGALFLLYQSGIPQFMPQAGRVDFVQ